MNRYEVKVRTDKTFIVEAESREEAERTALEDTDVCRDHAFTRSVVGIKDLTGDPIDLLRELVGRLEATNFRNKWEACDYCGGPRGGHLADCIIERACYCIRERDRKEQT